MATIGLIDVDGHHFPNLALMRISAYHKSIGDEVEWWKPPLFRQWYDVVYMSKIFSDAYSPDVPEPTNTNVIKKGGSGYCIYIGDDGKEHFDQSKNVQLPPYIEKMFPDYSIYPQFDFAVAMTSRGCPRGCAFCHVAAKEGRCSTKVADVKDFWNGQPHIEVLDPNITACREKRDLMRQYKETGATINFNQGLDIRFLNEEDINDINSIMYKADNWTFIGETQGSTKFHQHGIQKQFVRQQTQKKLVFCKWVRGGVLPTEYWATWNRPKICRGQLSLFDITKGDVNEQEEN